MIPATSNDIRPYTSLKYANARIFTMSTSTYLKKNKNKLPNKRKNK